MLRAPAEVRFSEELAALRAQDIGPRPPGWKLSPRAVRTFVVGSDGEAFDHDGRAVTITRKLYGDDPLVERSIVTLMSQRGLLLVGEPGTAKSMLSELLAAAISGDSTLTIQGSASTYDEQIKYGWNYARLLAEGPSLAALVQGPLYRGMAEGKVVRFEEVTRCQPEIQDGLIPVMSDKILFVPELEGAHGQVLGRPGFNVVATANLRDRGVHEMSSALKRRFNFETVNPIGDRVAELDLVLRETRAALEAAQAPVEVDRDVLELLVTTFRDLRRGQTEDGVIVDRPSSVMSTAEAVHLSVAAAMEAAYFDDGRLRPRHLARHLSGAVSQGQSEDAKKLDAYFEAVVTPRADGDEAWRAFLEGRGEPKA